MIHQSHYREKCPKDMKSVPQRDICTPMFIAILFTVVRIWKKMKCGEMNKEDVVCT